MRAPAEASVRVGQSVVRTESKVAQLQRDLLFEQTGVVVVRTPHGTMPPTIISERPVVRTPLESTGNEDAYLYHDPTRIQTKIEFTNNDGRVADAIQERMIKEGWVFVHPSTDRVIGVQAIQSPQPQPSE